MPPKRVRRLWIGRRLYLYAYSTCIPGSVNRRDQATFDAVSTSTERVRVPGPTTGDPHANSGRVGVQYPGTWALTHVTRFNGTGRSQTPHDVAQLLRFALDGVNTRAEQEAAGTPRFQ